MKNITVVVENITVEHASMLARGSDYTSATSDYSKHRERNKKRKKEEKYHLPGLTFVRQGVFIENQVHVNSGSAQRC